MAELEDRILRLEKIVTDAAGAPELKNEITAELDPPVDPDTVVDEKGITPKMYRDFDAVAQKLVEEHAGDSEPWTLDYARENFGNLLANEANK